MPTEPWHIGGLFRGGCHGLRVHVRKEALRRKIQVGDQGSHSFEADTDQEE